MSFELRQATAADLSFVRELTCRNMLRYYIHYDLLWQDEAFDVAWAGRDNWLILQEGELAGYFSLSRDARAVYIRELQIVESAQGQGAGSWAMDRGTPPRSEDFSGGTVRRRCDGGRARRRRSDVGHAGQTTAPCKGRSHAHATGATR